jgi:phosphate transport system substrate-binding protein
VRFNRFGGSLSLLAVRAFLQSAIGPGQKGLADDGNVALPDDFKSKLSAAINAIA